VPWLKEELAKDPDDHIKKYRVVFVEGKRVSWAVDTFNVQRRWRLRVIARYRRINERQRFDSCLDHLLTTLQQTATGGGLYLL